MGITQLSSIEIQDLINRYKSELKKLNFQVNEIEETIRELESIHGVVEDHEKNALSTRKKRKKGSSAKKARIDSPVVKTGKKRGRPPKVISNKEETGTLERNEVASVEKRTGYKLSAWDEAVMQSISDNGKALITSEIVENTAKKATQMGLPNDEEEVKKKVVRSLQKLVNRRGDLKKIKYKGKGFAYVMPEWLSAKGRLLKEYKR